MESYLEQVTHYVALTIQALAILVVAIGVLEALYATFRMLARHHRSLTELRDIWLVFARWLVAGLTLQLASDIVQTTVAPTWDDIGRLAATAATRTFLSYFLDRDIELVGERQGRAAS